MADHLTVLLAIWLLSIGTLAAAVWLANAITARELRDRYWREYNARRRGSNPSPPGRKPAPPAGPPEQPLAAQLIRYWAWGQEQVRRAWFDPIIGEPWPDDHQAAFAAGVAAERDRLRVDSEDWGSEALNAATGAMIEAYRRHTGQPETLIFYNNAKAILRDALGAYFNKGPTQRNSSNGGPAIPKPPIKPCPTGGRLITNNKPPKES